jgi:HAE1 family hydrophobic/amphiphilic exporter-1
MEAVPLTRFCLQNPVATTLFYLLVAFVGLLGLQRMGRSILPPVAIPIISISAPYAGAGPEEIERLVVEPVEDQLAALPSLVRVSASAQNGIGQLIVEFRFGSNIETDRANVQQAVDAARAYMPPDLIPPVVSEDDPTQAPIFEEAVSSELVDDVTLSALVTRYIIPALRATAGVGAVRGSGLVTRQFTIRPDAARLDALHGTVLDVFRSVTAGNDLLPGGKLASPVRESTIAVDAALTSTRQIENLPVMLPKNAAVRVRDLATVQDGAAEPFVIARVDGNRSIILYIGRAPGEDSLRTIAAIRKTFLRLADRYPELRFEQLRTDEPYTRAAIDGVFQTLGEGIALTVLVVLLFLHAWRNALIAAVAIPASVCAAFAAMWAAGLTINVLSLMGLSLTMGILVDDSIVIIEAISRKAALGLKPEEAALAGRRELGGVAFAITLVDVAVFTPIALMSGLIGEFMREFGLVIVLTTAFSLLVSFTLTPLLAARWALGRAFSLDGLAFQDVLGALRSRARTFPWVFRTQWVLGALAAWHSCLNTLSAWEDRLSKRYALDWLPRALDRGRVLGAATAALAILSLLPLFAGAIPAEFSPPVNRGEANVTVTLPPGTPLAATDAELVRISSAILDLPAVKHIEATAGRAFNGRTDIFASNVAQLGIVLADPTSSGDAVMRKVRELNRLVPDADITGAGTGMGGTPAVSYNVTGDAKRIDSAANRIASALRANPYAIDVTSSNAGLEPRLQYTLDAQRAALLNVSPDDAAQTARIAAGGAVATRARLASGLVDVVVQSNAAASGNVDALNQFTVRAADGRLVPIGDIFRLRASQEPAVIQRENGSRVVTVSANTIDSQPISFVSGPMAKTLRQPNFLPAGTRIEPRGDIEQFLDTVSKIFAAFGISLITVYATLAVLYRAYALPLVILLTVPLASIGAFGTLFVANELRVVFPSAALFQSQTLNLYSMLGIVMLTGLVAKNGILLVEFAERSIRSGATAKLAIQRAAQERFRPILMTTLAMVAGMLPLALGHTIGAEYRKALGTVVIGGLSTSLLLTLFVVPAVYMAYRSRTVPTPRRSLVAEREITSPNRDQGFVPVGQ